MRNWIYRIVKHESSSEDKSRFSLERIPEDYENEYVEKNPILEGKSIDEIAIELGYIFQDLIKFPEALIIPTPSIIESESKKESVCTDDDEPNILLDFLKELRNQK